MRMKLNRQQEKTAVFRFETQHDRWWSEFSATFTTVNSSSLRVID